MAASPSDLDRRLCSLDAWCIAISRSTCAATIVAFARRCLARRTSGTSSSCDIVDAPATGDMSSADCIADLMCPVMALISKSLIGSAAMYRAKMGKHVSPVYRAKNGQARIPCCVVRKMGKHVSPVVSGGILLQLSSPVDHATAAAASTVLLVVVAAVVVGCVRD